jgi:predicted PurR-regulated permease PerM
MKKAIGLDPVITIVAFLAGYTLLGVAGAVLIVPILAIGQIILDYKTEEQAALKEEK